MSWSSFLILMQKRQILFVPVGDQVKSLARMQPIVDLLVFIALKGVEGLFLRVARIENRGFLREN